jgi:hypothetical protein
MELETSFQEPNRMKGINTSGQELNSGGVASFSVPRDGVSHLAFPALAPERNHHDDSFPLAPLGNEKRLRNDIENAVLTGCDVVVTICSTLSPYVERMKSQFSTKIITIDEAMACRAIELSVPCTFTE